MMCRKGCWPSVAFLVISITCLRPEVGSAAVTQLITRGSQWKYFDQGYYPISIWTLRNYNEAGWKTGFAQFGYGEGDETTTVSFGGDPDNKYITTLFRRTFPVANAAAFNVLNLAVLRDDGVVVYLNGSEIYRNNMPAGLVSASTLASTNVAGVAEQTFFTVTLPSSGLVTGNNVLAVELHQAAPDSIDLSFDLELSAANIITVTRGPYLQRGTPSSLIVRWRTSSDTISRVRFGVEPDNLDGLVEDTTPKSEHELVLQGLQTETRYFYAIESSENTLARGPSYFFMTPPTGPKPTRVWALGDPGTANGNQFAVRDAYYNFTGARHTDLWLMLGDNAYGSGTDGQYQQAVFNVYPEMLRKSVLWPTIGNHDTYTDFTLTDFPYLHIFSLPTQGEAGGIPSGTKRYYSFNHANIHFVCLDSMSSDRSPGSPMIQWLQQDLMANTNTWLIAFWHHPPYSKGSHDSDYEGELVEMRQNVVPVLESYGVDLVLSGHSHAYERSFLINGHYGISDTFDVGMLVNAGDGRLEGNGPYRKTAAGPVPHEGAVYAVAGSSGQVSGGSLDHPAMFISLNLLGSIVLDINDNTLTANFLNANGFVSDHFTIQKGDNPNGLEITSVSLHEYIATLTWTSTPGTYYIIQYTPQMEAPDWFDVSNPVLATGASCSWSDFIPGDLTSGFFRVRLIPN